MPEAPPGGTRASRHQGPRKRKSPKHGGPRCNCWAPAAPSGRTLAQEIRETVLAYLTRNERTGPKSLISVQPYATCHKIITGLDVSPTSSRENVVFSCLLEHRVSSGHLQVEAGCLCGGQVALHPWPASALCCPWANPQVPGPDPKW